MTTSTPRTRTTHRPTPPTPTRAPALTEEPPPDDPGRAEDVGQIRRIVQDTETAFNTHDADLLVEHFAADVTTVGVSGAVLVGREDALATSRRLFAGPLADQHARYDIDDIRFLGPDVAIVRKLARAVDEHDVPVDVDHTMVAHYVLARGGERWWVVLRQNTLIAR